MKCARFGCMSMLKLFENVWIEICGCSTSKEANICMNKWNEQWIELSNRRNKLNKNCECGTANIDTRSGSCSLSHRNHLIRFDLNAHDRITLIWFQFQSHIKIKVIEHFAVRTMGKQFVRLTGIQSSVSFFTPPCRYSMRFELFFHQLKNQMIIRNLKKKHPRGGHANQWLNVIWNVEQVAE